MSEPLEVVTLGEALVVMDPLSAGPLRHGVCAVTVQGDVKGLPMAGEALALLRGRMGVER